MRTLFTAVVLAAISLSAGAGCRTCNDCPSRSYYYDSNPPPVVVPVTDTVAGSPAPAR